MMEKQTAKLFQNGSSQAVRLPKEFRFDGEKVFVRREGDAVILEPIPENWDWLDRLASLGPLDDDATGAALEGQSPQKRVDLGNVFE